MDIHPLNAFITNNSPDTRFPEQLSNEEFWNLAAQRARSTPTIQMDGTNELLLCALGHGYCILPLKMLDEILIPPHYFSFFSTPPLWMPGISAWRGEVIAVVDMNAYLFFHPPAAPGGHEEGMLLVTHHNDLKLGFFVSSVETIVGTYEERFIPLQNGVGRHPQLRTHVVKGITQVHAKEVLVLDTDLMFVDIEKNMRTATSYE
jgi:chemotaxis signal transduction protein